jgi:hypothetical protein
MIDSAISTSTSGGNHLPAGTRSNAAANSVIVCATVNEVTIGREIPAQAAERQHHAEQEQKMIESAKNMTHARISRRPRQPAANSDPVRLRLRAPQQENSLGRARR